MRPLIFPVLYPSTSLDDFEHLIPRYAEVEEIMGNGPAKKFTKFDLPEQISESLRSYSKGTWRRKGDDAFASNLPPCPPSWKFEDWILDMENDSLKLPFEECQNEVHRKCAIYWFWRTQRLMWLRIPVTNLPEKPIGRFGYCDAKDFKGVGDFQQMKQALESMDFEHLVSDSKSLKVSRCKFCFEVSPSPNFMTNRSFEKFKNFGGEHTLKFSRFGCDLGELRISSDKFIFWKMKSNVVWVSPLSSWELCEEDLKWLYNNLEEKEKTEETEETENLKLEENLENDEQENKDDYKSFPEMETCEGVEEIESVEVEKPKLRSLDDDKKSTKKISRVKKRQIIHKLETPKSRLETAASSDELEDLKQREVQPPKIIEKKEFKAKEPKAYQSPQEPKKVRPRKSKSKGPPSTAKSPGTSGAQNRVTMLLSLIAVGSVILIAFRNVIFMTPAGGQNESKSKEKRKAHL